MLRKNSIFFIVFFLTFTTDIYVSSKNNWKASIPNILISNPLQIGDKIFSDSLNISEILKDDYIGRKTRHPKDGGRIEWFSGQTATFKTIPLESIPRLLKEASHEASPCVVYGSCYITVDQFQEVSLRISCNLPFSVFLDGEEKITDPKPDPQKEETTEIELQRGKHTFLLKMLIIPENANSPTLKIEVTPQYRGTVATSLDPVSQFYRYDDLRFLKSLDDVAISPDGEVAAFVIGSRGDGYQPKKTFIELWNLKTKRTTSTLAISKTTNLPVFSPDSRKLVFASTGEKGSSIGITDLSTGSMEELISGVRGLSNIVFSPDGRRLYYLASYEENKKKKSPYKKYDELRDKLIDWDMRRAVFELNMPTRTMRRLTSIGDFTIMDFALSPNGREIAYSRMVPIKDRPYFKSEFWLQNTLTGAGAKITELVTGFENSPLNLCFSPSGEMLAFTSTPDIVGNSTPKEHNIYNSDLYILDLQNNTITKATEGFDPSPVERGRKRSVMWSKQDEAIYFLATNRSRRKIFKLNIKPGKRLGSISNIRFEDTNVEFFSKPSKGSLLLSVESSFLQPPCIYLHNIRKNKTEKLFDPNKIFLSRTRMGSFERFDFLNEQGRKIDGWILKPFGFDASKKYPLIVYYYGGVSPRLEKFTFAHHWLNANGYVVYVLNPSGCYGEGDEFADLHINDWGTLASEDIIQGVKRLLSNKKYIDPEKLGAYGGSYGGFITMDIATETSMFTALVSMYGISNITSYWGAATWGFTYGDMALARSYPWKDKDIFVKKSPVFKADKIESPILFLHGEGDVNVPPGESRQLFTSLRVLNKEAVLVEFPGEDHGIAGSFASLKNHREIMLEWFDKHLKNQADAWNARWKK